MKATLLRTERHPSKYGGVFYYAFFKGEDGKSYRSCLSPTCGNFNRWSGLIGRENITVENLVFKGNMVDADSYPKEVKDEKAIG